MLGVIYPLFSVGTLEPIGYYRSDEELGWMLQENFPSFTHTLAEGFSYRAWSNEFGCFDVPYRGEEEYIFLVGDSFLQQYSGVEGKVGSVIEGVLQKRVLKCGVAAYGTRQEGILTERIIKKIGISPQLIIVGCYINDFWDDSLYPNFPFFPFSAHTAFKGKLSYKAKEWLIYHSHFYRFVAPRIRPAIAKAPLLEKALLRIGILTKGGEGKGTWHEFFQRYELAYKGDPALKEGWQKHLASIKYFKDFSDQSGSRLLFVLIPAKVQVYDFLLPKSAEQEESFDMQPQEVLANVFEEYRISVFDLLPYFRSYANATEHQLDYKNDLYFNNDDHWSPRGQYLAGLLISRHILENNILPIEDKRGKLEKIENELKEKFGL